MTDNARKAFEFIKNNKEAMEKFSKAKTLKSVLDIAKEYNLDLTEEDLNITKEKRDILEGKKKIDLSELEKVSGAGDVCACVGMGVGGGDGYAINCICYTGGGGDDGSNVFCICMVGGGGNSDNSLGEIPKSC